MANGTEAEGRRIRVMIVEDQTAIREMLVSFVAAMPEFVVVGEAADVPEALRVAEATNPRVVVLDWMLLGGLGLEFLREVRVDPPPYVLVFSANTTDLAVRESLSAGAKGFIEKTASFQEFTAALKSVAVGRSYLGPAITRSVRRLGDESGHVTAARDLSLREQEVLRLLAHGLTSKEIGARLQLSVRTVEKHRASLSRRTGIKSEAQLALHAVRLGLVEAPTPQTGGGA